MSSYHLSNGEVDRYLAEYCASREGQGKIDGMDASQRLMRSPAWQSIRSMKVIRNEHAPIELTTKHDLARHGVPREVIEALEHGSKEQSVARAMFAWKRGEGIRGRTFGLLLHGPGKGKSVAACMAIDPRFTPNPRLHTKLCVAESTLMSLEMRNDSSKELQRYKMAHTLVVDSIGQSGMYSRATCEAVVELMRKRWADHKTTILTSRADLPKLQRVYGDNWVTFEKYCHMHEVIL